jgi:hypothetical protein
VDGRPVARPSALASVMTAGFGELPRPIETRSRRDRQKAGLLQLNQHGSQIEEIAACRFAQDAQCPDEGQAAPGGFAASVGIIQQKLIGRRSA